MTSRALVAAALALGALSARADQADDIARLREEAAALRQSLDKLEAEIQALEAGNPAPLAPGSQVKAAAAPKRPPEPSPVAVHRNWSQVHPGVSKQEVDALLGKPERVMRLNGDLVWYYVYPGLGRGSVFFNGEDKVTATQAPRAGWFQ